MSVLYRVCVLWYDRLLILVEFCVMDYNVIWFFFFFQAEDGIRDVERSRGLGDVYKRQVSTQSTWVHKLVPIPHTKALRNSAILETDRLVPKVLLLTQDPVVNKNIQTSAGSPTQLPPLPPLPHFQDQSARQPLNLSSLLRETSRHLQIIFDFSSYTPQIFKEQNSTIIHIGFKRSSKKLKVVLSKLMFYPRNRKKIDFAKIFF
eukprot:TRINITY_DN36573_c0_g1_i3.p1 TRINITY_DN36573_c0_g1~~TRINITY_DN36573_c0_g1_i3.p1  ORF type:complete len:204 (+),score=18.78 TRINITY_DN36573_c0_g1_i3:20-631(+)